MNVKISDLANICIISILLLMMSLAFFIVIITSNDASVTYNKQIYDFKVVNDGSNDYVTSGADGIYAGNLSGSVRLIDHNNGSVDLIVRAITDKGKEADMSFINVPVDKRYTVTQNRKVLNSITLDNGGSLISDIYIMSDGNARISVAIGIGDTRYDITGITNKVGLAFLRSANDEETPGMEDAQGNIIMTLDENITILHKTVELNDGDNTNLLNPLIIGHLPE